MIFQCVHCRALVATASVALDADGAHASLACSECGRFTALAVAASSTSARVTVDADAAARAHPPARTLPAPTAMAVAQPLSPTVSPSASFSQEVRERIVNRTAKIGMSEKQAPLSSSFDRLLDRWDDPAEHGKFVHAAAAIDELAFAGQRYRAVLDEVPSDAAAKRAQNDILSLAMVAFGSVRDSGEGLARQKRMLNIIAVALCIAVIGGLGIWLVARHGLGARDDVLPPTADGATMNGVR
ncbi:MAG TPA: hypothetical protein VGO62_05370 [Myxococcota bacterium]